ncbi:phage tail tape measure protein [Nocardia sp. IFM 10818]
MADKPSIGAWRGDPAKNEHNLSLSAADNQLTSDRWKRAAEQRGQLDATMVGVQSGLAAYGAQLEGLDKSLKDLDSLRRKVASAAQDGIDPQRFLKRVEDLNRYTFTFPEDQYSAGTKSAKAELKERGFKQDGESNLWADPAYKGYHSWWKNPETGDKFEVQFHTPESFQAKSENHPLYRLNRSGALDEFDTPEQPDGSAPYKDAVKHLQAERTKQVSVPPGVEEISKRPPKSRTELPDSVDPEALNWVQQRALESPAEAPSPPSRQSPGFGPGTPHRSQVKKPNRLGNIADKAKAGVIGGARNIAGKAGRMAGGAGALLGGVGTMAGMVPQFAAAMGSPGAVAQEMLDQAPDLAAGMLETTGGGPAGDAPVGGASAVAANRQGPQAKPSQPPAGSPGAGKPGQQSPAAAANASAEAMRKSSEAANASTAAMKKSTEAVKGSSDGFKKFSGELSKSAGAQKNAATATKSMTGAQKNLNSAMKQNPLGMIVTTIGLAISAITLLVQNWDKVKVAFDWVYKNVLTPVGKWFSDIWSGTVVPMFKTSVESVTGFFSGMGTAVGGVWDGIVDKIRGVVGIIANLVGKLPDISFMGFSTKDIAASLQSFASPDKKADGGILQGPGGPRDDVIPVLASNGEYIVNAAATSKNMPLLESINSGAVPKFADGGVVHSQWSSLVGDLGQTAVGQFFFGSSGKAPEDDGDEIQDMDWITNTAKTGLASAAGNFLSGMLGDALGVFGVDRVPYLFQAVAQGKNLVDEKFQNASKPKSTEAGNPDGDTGGEEPGATGAEETQPTTSGGLSEKAQQLIEFAKGVEGAKYSWGGVNWGDCSGAISALANYVAGWPPFGSRFSTANEEAALRARGAKIGRGPSGSLSIGWYHRTDQDAHTAATLPNGVNFEMGGARGNGQYGGSAAGANSSQFTQFAYFPPEMFLAAGGSVSGAGSSISDSIPAWLSDGEFVVNAKSADANRSLLDAINQDAGALINSVAPFFMPNRALPGTGSSGGTVDQSTTIHMSTPDVDTAYQKAKTWEAQRALTYVSRWR